MITPLLEELIYCGKAKNVTFNCSGGASIFRMPQGKHAVLHSFIVNPFVDMSAPQNYNVIVDVMKKIMHQLRISSKKSTNHWVFRWDLQMISSGGIDYYLPVGHIVIDTYLTHESDIFFEWLHAPDNSIWTITETTIPPEANNPNRPLIGYGSQAGALTSVNRFTYNDGSSSEYTPFNVVTPPSAPNVPKYNQFEFPATRDTQLSNILPGSKTLYPYNFPIVTAQMVVIDGTPKNNFKSSN